MKSEKNFQGSNRCAGRGLADGMGQQRGEVNLADCRQGGLQLGKCNVPGRARRDPGTENVHQVRPAEILHDERKNSQARKSAARKEADLVAGDRRIMEKFRQRHSSSGTAAVSTLMSEELDMQCVVVQKLQLPPCNRGVNRGAIQSPVFQQEGAQTSV